MAHPECNTPDHQLLIGKLPPKKLYIIDSDNPLVTRGQSGGRFVTEAAFLQYASDSEPELTGARSNNYLVWSFLRDNRHMPEDIIRTDIVKGQIAYDAQGLVDFVRANEVRLGPGEQHIRNLETLVGFFLKIQWHESYKR